MVRQFVLITMLGISLASCKSVHSKPLNIDTKASERTLFVPIEDIGDTPLVFCPEKRSFSLINAFWLSYLSVIEYSHFKEVGPVLEKLGFGERGEGQSFLKNWWELRIKRITEKRLDTDDQWSSETERKKRLEEVLSDYKKTFGDDYRDDGVSSLDLEKSLVFTKRPLARIQFISGQSKKTGEKSAAQVVYAEHRKLNLSVLGFRGNEASSNPNKAAGLGAEHVTLEGYGQVHKTTYEAYQEVEQIIVSVLRTRSEVKPMNLWITGHSTGGALATILTARLMQIKASGDLSRVNLVGAYHFGSPRVFDATAARKFDEELVKNKLNFVRFRNYKDVFSGLPVTIRGRNLDFWHVGALAYFSENKHLSYGDGWEKIEAESDIIGAFPSNLDDNNASQYFKLLKSANEKTQETCEPVAGERPLLPFKENPADR
ncbi:MAG: lipase family protein [Proteobacteria bacterium]|nr:lipase family protein [Pseudomonadota bacterium]